MSIDVAVYHNIVWPKYKGAVFSALHERSQTQGQLSLSFVQIAETDGERAALNGVDLRYHRYPFQLLFRGAYDSLPTRRLMWTLARHVWHNPARLVVLPGYHRLEYWAMLASCILRGKQRAVFCDSTGHEQVRHGFKAGLKRQLKRLFFRQCDGYFGYGLRSAEYLRDNGAGVDRIFQPCQAAALPIGFDAESALARRIQARQQDPSWRFLYVGRLSPEKGLLTLLRAFQAFVEQHRAGQLVLVGAGPQRDELFAACAALGLADRVEFTGALDIDGLADQYARALCLVLPSRSEPWGLVVNEALHHGCPVVVSEACGCRPELVIDGRTGYAHPVDGVAEIQACLTLVTQHLADAAAVGRVCQKHMQAYTPAQAAANILSGCERILRGN